MSATAEATTPHPAELGAGGAAQPGSYGSNIDRARQGAGAGRPLDLRFRGGLLRHCRAARHVRGHPRQPGGAARPSATTRLPRRPDILDRRGEVLATDVRVPSLYGEPRHIIDVEAVELLTAELPGSDSAELRERLSSKRGFVWLKREITPKQQKDVYRMGLPGIGFLSENKRAYPNGAEVSHVIGHVNIDNQGIAGMEKWLDGNGLAALHLAGLATDRLQTPVELAVDLRVQHALRDELVAARTKFRRWPPPGSCLTCAPARSSPWFRSPTTIPTIRARRSIRRGSTG
jgi:hypothetical protein